MIQLFRRFIGPPVVVDNGTPWGAIGAWQVGLLLSMRAWWVGGHYSEFNKRLCVNLIPCVTVWVAAPGGRAP
jgi:hypothetical protein